jgi:hypothetical protein
MPAGNELQKKSCHGAGGWQAVFFGNPTGQLKTPKKLSVGSGQLSVELEGSTLVSDLDMPKVNLIFFPTDN